MAAMAGGAVNPRARRVRGRQPFTPAVGSHSLYDYVRSQSLTGLVRESVAGGIPVAGGSYRLYAQLYFQGGEPRWLYAYLVHRATGERVEVEPTSPTLAAAVLHTILGQPASRFHVYRGLQPFPEMKPIPPFIYELVHRLRERERELGVRQSPARVDGRKPGPSH